MKNTTWKEMKEKTKEIEANMEKLKIPNFIADRKYEKNGN